MLGKLINLSGPHLLWPFVRVAVASTSWGWVLGWISCDTTGRALLRGLHLERAQWERGDCSLDKSLSAPTFLSFLLLWPSASNFSGQSQTLPFRSCTLSPLPCVGMGVSPPGTCSWRCARQGPGRGCVSTAGGRHSLWLRVLQGSPRGSMREWGGGSLTREVFH